MAKAQKRKATRPAPKKAKRSTSKLDQIVGALRAPKGATIAMLATLTGWQTHSVRGAIAGALKKQRGLHITSKNVGQERVYRIGGKP